MFNVGPGSFGRFVGSAWEFFWVLIFAPPSIIPVTSLKSSVPRLGQKPEWLRVMILVFSMLVIAPSVAFSWFFSILTCIVLTFRVAYFVRVYVCVSVRLHLSILFIYFLVYYFLCVCPAKYLGIFSLFCATYWLTPGLCRSGQMFSFISWAPYDFNIVPFTNSPLAFMYVTISNESMEGKVTELSDFVDWLFLSWDAASHISLQDMTLPK